METGPKTVPTSGLYGLKSGKKVIIIDDYWFMTLTNETFNDRAAGIGIVSGIKVCNQLHISLNRMVLEKAGVK